MKVKTLLSLMNSDMIVLSFHGCWAWSTGVMGSMCLWKGVLHGGTLRLSCLRLLRLLLLSSLIEAWMEWWLCVIITRSLSVDSMLLRAGKNRFNCGRPWWPENCVMSDVVCPTWVDWDYGVPLWPDTYPYYVILFPCQFLQLYNMWRSATREIL